MMKFQFPAHFPLLTQIVAWTCRYFQTAKWICDNGFISHVNWTIIISNYNSRFQFQWNQMIFWRDWTNYSNCVDDFHQAFYGKSSNSRWWAHDKSPEWHWRVAPFAHFVYTWQPVLQWAKLLWSLVDNVFSCN